MVRGAGQDNEIYQDTVDLGRLADGPLSVLCAPTITEAKAQLYPCPRAAEQIAYPSTLYGCTNCNGEDAREN